MDDIIIIDDRETDSKREQVEVIDESEELVFIQMRDFTTSGAFTPRNTDINQSEDSLPVKGKGRLDTVSIIADLPDYSVTVWIDDNAVVDDNWPTLDNTSEEMTHVDAYFDQPDIKDGNVIVVEDYPFTEYCSVNIQTDGEVTFELIRVEIILEQRHG